jgi:hypothetical protein
MVEGDSARHPYVVVVGDARDDLVTHVLRLAREYEIGATRCDDVYSAVVELAAQGSRRLWVIGRFREMARENSRFFTLAARNGARCCCLVDQDSPTGRSGVLAAVRTGVLLVARMEEIEPILEAWLASGGCHSGGLAEEEFRATEAELDALLGHGADE